MGQESKTPTSCVIVRAWGGEPVEMIVQDVDKKGDRVLVSRPNGHRSIGLPVADVFPFDKAMMGRLTAAYECGDDAYLGEIYGRLEENKRTCIFIPVAIDSGHG